MPEEHRMVRRRRRSRVKRVRRWLGRLLPWRALVGSVVIVIIVLGVGQAVLIADASNNLESSLRSLNRVMGTLGSKAGTELTLNDFNRVETSLNEVSRNLARMQQRTRLVAPLTTLNADWGIMFDSLEAGQALAAAGQRMLAGIEPTIFFMVAGEDEGALAGGISSGERIVELLTIGRGQFISASDHLAQARSLIDSMDLTGISASLLLQLEDLEAYYQQIEDMNTLLLDAPELLTEALGLQDTQRYLILAQNSDELRPSGGYISTYGWMTVRNGRIVDYSYSPSTVTSPIPPNDELASEIPLPDWWIQFNRPITAAWDGSWYVDFPSTAAMARWYYNTGNNPQSPVDGVIAIDIYGFEAVLSILGQVHVPGYDVTITPQNFREIVYDIRAFGEGELPHKRFVADVYRQIFSDWQTVSEQAQQNADLLGVALEALQQKHIMIYLPDERLAQAMDVLGWSGAQRPGVDHDYLLVADANLGNKSNRSILRQTTYDVQIRADGTLHGRTTIAYDYPARIAEEDPAVNPLYHGRLDYGNLLQVFVPAQSSIVATGNLDERVQTVAQDEHTILVSRVGVRYDDSARFRFEYETPPLIEQIGPYQRYRLLLQRQPGMSPEPVTVQVTLPPGARVVNTSPAPATSYSLEQLVLDFRLTLETDQWIEVTFE
ncbi:MAG: DUF4012 domain-containing protein [Phototrophicaceae bacterium]